MLSAEHLVGFSPLFSFQASWDDSIFPALHCPTTQRYMQGSCYVGVVPPPGNSVGHQGVDQEIYTDCRSSTPAVDLNYKHVGPVVLRCYFKFSPRYQTGTYIGEAGPEREEKILGALHDAL